MSEKKSPAQVALGGAICVLIIVGGIGAMFALGSREQETRKPADADRLPAVETVGVLAYNGGVNLEVDGVVTPLREIQVSAQIDGTIASKAEACRAGNFVRRGTLLLEIDPDDYELNVRTASKQFEQAIAESNEVDIEISNTQALIDLAQRELEIQQNELARLERLKPGNVIAESSLDQARRAVVVAENSLQLMTNRVRLHQAQRERLQIAQHVAQAKLDKAELDLRRTRIVAPVDGVIVSDVIEQGAFVQRGTALFTIEDTSSTEIKTNLQVSELYWLWRETGDTAASDEGDGAWAYEIPEVPVSVQYQVAGRGDLRFLWSGELKRYDGIGFDAKTRTVPCRILVADPRAVRVESINGGNVSTAIKRPPALVRGMFVTATIHLQPREPFVLVPESVVQPGKIVWRLREGRLERLGPLPLVRLIDASSSTGTTERAWIVSAGESGLQAGDRLVRNGLSGLELGRAVREAPADTRQAGS
jgi:multidrug efflux pump subunit AcrA (membrane-fusion protein)